MYCHNLIQKHWCKYKDKSANRRHDHIAIVLNYYENDVVSFPTTIVFYPEAQNTPFDLPFLQLFFEK
jgi:hypothetical protein